MQLGLASRHHSRSSLPSFLLSSASEVICPVSLETIRADFQACRHQTLALCENIPPAQLCIQSHPDFSPVGWHLGHIAYTESFWVTQRLGQPFGGAFSQSTDQYKKLFAADGLPKTERQNLPSLAEILAYLAAVRSQTENALLLADDLESLRLWHWLIQHESQHAETICMVLAMHQLQEKKMLAWPGKLLAQSDWQLETTIPIEAGEFHQGCDDLEAIDNECPSHPVWLDRYEIDRTPVTCAQFREFVRAGGYQTEQWWSPQGWQWQQLARVEAPLYWPANLQCIGGVSPAENYPVCGISWYEADAYARFAGKRLPTEAEWEKAAGQVDLIGAVWEWTDSWFEGYPGFCAFPYEGYSKAYFDRAHRVLRGGSWATSRWTLRPSFRNWYHPHRREMFAGFRCAL